MRITSPVSDEGPQGVESSELEYLDVTPGTGTASKALVLDASGNVVMPTAGLFGLSRTALAAAGSTSADAAVIARQVVAVTGADGTKGVALPAAATTVGPILVINTNASNGLLVYPIDGGDDQINGEAEDAAVTIGPANAAWFVPTSATQWYCAGFALTAATVAQLNYLAAVTAGTVAASKALVVDANKDLGDFRNLDAVNIDSGASGTAGSVDVFPATAAKGKLAIVAADSAGDTATTITNASQAGARTYTVPDAGASASFVMTEGAATINGVKTFGSVPVLPAGGVTLGSTTITEAEAGVLDGVTAGTSAASKAVTLDAASKLDGLPLVKRSLTALATADLEALAGTPVEVVAAPGAGKLVQVLGWRFRLIFVGTAMDDAASDGNLILKYAGGSTIDAMEADGLIDAAATTQGLTGNLTELLAAETALANKAVQISNDGAEYTVVGGGDATAEVEVFYRILDSNPA